MNTPLRILHLEDDPTQVALVRATLEAAGFAPDVVVVQTKADYLAHLDQGWELVVAKYELPQLDGLQALALFKDRGLDIAFILISGISGEEEAVAAMQAGASAYVLKHRLARLGPAVERGLRNTVERRARRQAEAALRGSEEHLTALIASVGGIVWEADAVTFQFTFVSSQAERLLGYPLARWLEEPTFWAEHIHAEDRKSAVDYCVSRTRENRHHEFEYRMLAADGRTIWVRDIVTVLSDNGQAVKLRGIMVDITARKEAAEQLHQSEERFRTMFTHAPTGIALIDSLTGQIKEVNPKFALIAGRSREEMHRIDWMQITHPDDVQEDLDNMARLNAGEITGFHMNKRYLRPDGSVVWISMTVASIVSADSAHPHHLCMIEDITARKTLESQMITAQRHEAIGTLASGLAHDFNNILTPMLLVTDLLEHSNTDASERELLASVKTSAQRGAAIVRHLLAYSRGVDGERRLVAVTRLIEEMTSVARATFPRDITVIEDTAVDLWSLVADVTQIQQVLMNLCLNARDAMPSGGELSITARNVELVDGDRRLGPSAHPGRFVHVAVRDTGIGIPRPIIDQIFEPFFTTKAIDKGSGLGLSSVMGIVRSHGGLLTVDSTPAHGSTFHVYLPAAGEALLSLVSEPTPSPTTIDGATILVVDDESAIRSLTRRCLEKNGYRVLTATNGQEALQVFEAHQRDIQLVLTDIMMPVMGGVEFARALHLLSPEMRVIGASGLEEITTDGIDELLVKPFTVDALLAAVSRQLLRSAR